MQQPVLNVGLLGHVANGKSSLVRAITAEKTARGDSRCMKKGGQNREMTIQVGYSNAKIYMCPNCPKPDCYTSVEGSQIEPPICDCGTTTLTLVQYVSFVDSPGHRSLMQNMISGSAVMDSVLIVVDSTKKIPQIQTLEHLIAAEIIGLNNYIAIAQNKIDLVLNETNAKERLQYGYNEIQEFIKNTAAEGTPVIPVSLSPARQINVKLLLEYLVEHGKPSVKQAYTRYPLFIYCIRSFDINKSMHVAKGDSLNIKGGVIGGSVMNGVIRIGDVIEIRPGVAINGVYTPLTTRVTSLYTGTVPLQEAGPGGLIGIGTTLDPALTRSDAMVGMCAGLKGELPEICSELLVNIQLLKMTIGNEDANGPPQANTKIKSLQVNDVIQIAIGSGTVRAKVTEKIDKRGYKLITERPVCPVIGQAIPISKMLQGAWTIIGKAELQATLQADPVKQRSSSDKPKQTADDYNILIDRVCDEYNTSTNLSGQLKLTAPKLARDGGAKILWTNFEETCKKLHRDLNNVKDFFIEELHNKNITLTGTNVLVIHGKARYRSEQIQKILLDYINTFVRCPLCKSVNTLLSKERGMKYQQLLCKECGSESLI